jgi:hypothetical protein
VASLAVVGVAEAGDKLHKGICVEPGFGISRIKDGNGTSATFDEETDKTESRSGEPILVGHHNVDCITVQHVFQYGNKSTSFEIERRSNILDNGDTRVLFVDFFELALERASLFFGGHASVSKRLCCGKADTDLPVGRVLDMFVFPRGNPTSYSLTCHTLVTSKPSS